jgi:hypothetical protein
MNNVTDAGGGPRGPDGVATVADLEARLTETEARIEERELDTKKGEKKKIKK